MANKQNSDSNKKAANMGDNSMTDKKAKEAKDSKDNNDVTKTKETSKEAPTADEKPLADGKQKVNVTKDGRMTDAENNEQSSNAQETDDGIAEDKKDMTGTVVSSKDQEEPLAADTISDMEHDGNNADKEEAFDHLSQEEQIKKVDSEGKYNGKAINTTPDSDNQSQTATHVPTQPKKKKPKSLFFAPMTIITFLVGIGVGGIGTYGVMNAQNHILTTNHTTIDYKDLAPIFSTDPTLSSMLQYQLLSTVFANEHADLVTEKEIDDAVKQFKDSQPDYEKSLAETGMTEGDLRKIIKGNLAMQNFIAQSVNLSESDLKTAYETYVPTQKVFIGLFDNKKKAEAYRKDPTDKKYNADQSLVEVGSYNDSGFSDKVIQAVGELKKDQVSEVIEESSQVFPDQKIYVVVRGTENHKDKGTFAEEKDTIKKEITDQKTNDGIYVAKTLRNELERLGVKYRDDDIKRAVENSFKLQIGEETEQQGEGNYQEPAENSEQDENEK